MPRRKQKALCCPDKPHYSKGFCHLCYDRAYREQNSKQINDYYSRWKVTRSKNIRGYKLKGKYGITLEIEKKMIERQNGLCAICKSAEATDVDHNHDSKVVRGVLCGSCNRGLGLFKDSPEILSSAASYINNTKNGVTREYYCGIDNGITGAAALILDSEVEFFNTPVTHAGKDNIVDANRLHKWLKQRKQLIKHVALELGQKQPRFGARGNYSQGDSNGTIRTILVMLEIPFTLIPPQKWQKEMHAGIRGAGMDTKTASFEACARLFPDHPIPRLSDRHKHPHDGFADALLIAEFARRHNL